MGLTVTPPFAPSRWQGWLARVWGGFFGAAHAPPTAWVEEYEPRVLYSADLAPHALLLSNGPQVVEQRVLDARGEFAADAATATQAREVVIVDGAVENKNILINQILTNSRREVDIITLDAAQDGVSQVTAALAGRSDIAAVHIISHGADGEVQLGNGKLDAVQLAARHDEIAQWAKSLTADASILLYGCDVAADARGQAFVQQLSAVTGADVAASTNLTGSNDRGGDWRLEFVSGTIANTPLVFDGAPLAWSGVLATFSVTNTSGANASGSLLRAISDANATAGADIIQFNIAGAGVHVINPSFVLTITDTVTIDGTLNNGVSANGGGPAIVLDGASLFTNGLTLADGADGSTIRGLVIRNFNGDGILIEQGANGNTIAGNYIGNLREDGTRSGGSDQNSGAGIHINSLFNTIGGSAAADRNVISGNDGAGILIENPAGSAVLGVNSTIQGNIIGAERDGTTALANSVGIELRDAAQWDRIVNNTIVHNTGSGVVIGGAGAAVHDLLIGDGAGDENAIAFNGGDGVTVLSGTHNAIVRNSIYSNAGLGIDLRNNAAETGVTPNDSGDADSGGNELQNTPVLASAQIISGTQVRVIGTLNAAAGTQHLIEFFSNTTADPSGHGEGQTYIGSVTVTTDGSGNASFNSVLTATLPAGSFISATATNYYTIIIVPVRGSTSEFSNNVALNNTAPVLDATQSPQLNPIAAGAPAPIGAAGTLVSALVDFASPAGQLDNVTDPDSGALLGIAITAVDTVNGTLYFSINNGGAWTAVGAVSNTNALLLAANGNTRLYYQTNVGASSTASALTIRAWDRSTGSSGSYMDVSTNGGATAFSSTTDTVALAVSAVNSAPVNTVPGAQSVNEDAPLAIGGISVNDANGNLATTQLTVNNGTLNVTLAGGAVIVAGANSSADLTLGGTQAQINSALATLTYQGNANFNGSDTLRVLSTDSAGSPVSDTDTVAITVNAVNDPPAAGGGNVTGTEDTAYVFTWADFNVSDLDTAISGATALRMDVLPASGVLEYLSGSSWTPVALGQLVSKTTIDTGALRFVPTADESGHDGYATPGIGNLLQDYARLTYTPVQTTAIAIVNANGQADTLAEGGVQNPATGWTTSGADAGAQNLTAAQFPADHDNSLYANAGATLTQTLAATFTAARDYSLAFEAGWRGDAGYPTEPGFRVELWAGATLMGSMDESSVTSVQGEFVSGVLNMTGGSSGALEGSALQIRLIGTSSQANFDNVVLTSFVPSTDAGAAATMTVDITPVNDAPVVAGGSTLAYTENAAASAINTALTVADVDTTLATATVSITANFVAGQDVLGFTNVPASMGNIAGSYSAGTGVMTLASAGNTATLAQWQAALRAVTYSNSSDAPSTAARTVSYQVSDGQGVNATSNVLISTVNVTAANDAPAATNLSAAESYTEDTALNLIDMVVSDVDSANVTATLTLSNAGAGSLNTGTSGAVTSTYNAGTGVWTASGAIANVNTLLAGLTFTPAANFNGSFTIATSVSDGVAAPVSGVKAMTGIAVNDAPTATNLSAVEAYTEDTALNLTDIVISDIDSANVTATLTLSNATAGSLSTGTSGVVTSTYNAGTGVWTASGAIANVNALLAGLTFTPTADFNVSFTVATSVSDGVAAALTGSKAITGVAVNDAPTATNLSAAETYTEDTALNLVDIVIGDIDSASVTATLTLSNPAAGGLNTATSGAVTSTYVAGTGMWTASGAIGNVNTLLAGLVFTPTANFNGNFTIATSVSDGVAAPVTGSKNVTGVAVNDGPTVTNLNAAETYTEDTPLNLTDIVISDIDSANVTATLTLSNPGAGTLNTGTSGAVTSTYNAGTGVWSASGAIANVNTLLAGLSFTPSANFNGSFTIATSVSDGVAAPLAGNKNFTGIAVNDAPVAVNDSLAAGEDTPVTYTALQLLGNDSDNDGPALAIANVVSGTGGSAVLNGDGSVTFTPGANFNGAAGFTYTATDGTLTSNVATVSINVASINDAPLLTVPGAQTVIWNTVLPIAGISATDVDGDLTSLNLGVASGTLTVTPVAGALVVGNGGATVTVSGSEAAINTTVATLRYAPNTGFAGADNLVISAEDGAGFAVPGTVAITVNAVNSVPVIGGVARGSVTEDAAPTLAASGTLTISDADPGQSRFVPQTNVAGALGTFSISSAGDWTYTAANSQPAVQQLGAGATRSETFTVVSADGSAARDVVITISGTDDGAVLAANTGARVDEGASLVLTAAMLDGSDIDGGPPPTYRVLTAPGSGVLNLAGNALRAGDTFTQDDINNGRLAYSHNGSETTADGFDFALLDATATAGIRDTFSLAITPLNDPPAAADVRAATSDSASVVFQPGDFGYFDADGDALARIRITTLPATGALLLGTTAIGVNQEIAVADVAAGRLAFAPQPGSTTQVLAVIGFQVSDGQAYSAAHTVAITVAPSQMVAPPQNALVLTAPAPDSTAPVAPASQTTATPAVQRPAASLPGVPDASPNTTVEAALTPAAAAVSQGAPQSPARAPAMDGIERAAHRMSSDSLLPPSFITFAPGVLQAGFTPQNLGAPEASAATRAAAATGSVEFTRGLDRVREGARDAETLEQNILVSTVSASAGLSVGYVLWLLRGSLLLTSLLSSLPAWRFVDPLPVLGRLGDDEEEDTESLESIVSESGASGVRGAA